MIGEAGKGQNTGECQHLACNDVRLVDDVGIAVQQPGGSNSEGGDMRWLGGCREKVGSMTLCARDRATALLRTATRRAGPSGSAAGRHTTPASH